MTDPASSLDPPASRARYETRVGGHLDDRWADGFPGPTPTRLADGTTLLSGAVPDQAALHGLLRTIRDLGLPLLAVTSLPPDHWRPFVRHPTARSRVPSRRARAPRPPEKE